ncbi:MAG: NAD-dependent succinate-semialdehyde dehydrogenase [Rickettsiales bacterium]
MINSCYVNGKWISANSGKTFPVINPGDMLEIGHVPYCGAQEAAMAVKAAYDALKTWKKTTGKERSKILRKAFDLVMLNHEKLARTMVLEQGKAIKEARNEITYSASFIEWFAEEAKRIYGDIVPVVKANQKLFTLRQPIGVVAAITPWNFPLAMIVRKVAPALAAGCTVVIKPSEETPYTALEFVKILEEAGLPAGVVNVVFGDAPAIGEVLTTHPDIAKFTFTGSTKVGKMLYAKCTSTVKKVTLELGGNAPFIVFDDADLDKAVAGLTASKLRNGGQSCICANRVYVHESVVDEFVSKLKKTFGSMRVGDGLKEETDIGPMINKAAVAKILGLLDDAKQKGSEVIYSGDIPLGNGCYAAPTIIINKSTDTEIEKNEIFGPIISIFTFKTDEEVLMRANNTRYGLASYFYTKSQTRMWEVAEELEYGLVGANDVALSSEMASFGGVKESGIGREGGSSGIDEFLEDKFMATDVKK